MIVHADREQRPGLAIGGAALRPSRAPIPRKQAGAQAARLEQDAKVGRGAAEVDDLVAFDQPGRERPSISTVTNFMALI